MFENWQADLEDEVELAKNQAFLIGSFIDPERVKKMMGNGENVHISSDEELEASMKMVRGNEPSKSIRKRKKIRTEK